MTSTSAALIVIDVQNGFIRPASAPVVGVIRELVDRWQQTGRDTVFTRYINHAGSMYERLFHWSHLQAAPETDIVPELQPYAEKATAVVDKHTYTLFNEQGTELARERGWTDIYVCGIATESCVLKTAVDAFEQEIVPWVIGDASASHAGQEAHDAGILVARRFIGPSQIIRAADVV